MKKAISIITLTCFIVSSVFADGFHAVLDKSQQEKHTAQILEDFIIPQDLGSVTGSYIVQNKTNGPVVINIQDLHCNPEVQRNISKILESFDKKYSLKNVYVEGGYGNIDTSWLCSIKDNKVKQEITENLLNMGRLTGSESYSVKADRPDLLKGIENEAFHKANIVRLGKILGRKEYYESKIKELNKSVELLEAKYLTSRNKRFSKLVESHRKGAIKPEKYYSLLSKYAETIIKNPDKYNNITSLNLAEYPNIMMYIELTKMSKDLDYNRISLQLRQFIGILKNKLPYNVYVSLLEKTGNFTKTNELYIYLSRFAYTLEKENPGTIASRFPELNKFFVYTRLNQQINLVKLLEEDKLLVEEIRIAFSKDTSELEVSFLADFHGYFEDYLLNALCADDYRYFNKRFDKFKTIWNKHSLNGVMYELSKDFNLLNEFYASNCERNECFIKNIKEIAYNENLKTDRENKDVSPDSSIHELLKKADIIVMVTGGFHSDGLAKIFKEKGISYVTITPAVNHDTRNSTLVYNQLAIQQAQHFSAVDLSKNNPDTDNPKLNTNSSTLALALGSSDAKVISISEKEIVVEIEGEQISLSRNKNNTFELPAGNVTISGKVFDKQVIESAVNEAVNIVSKIELLVNPLQSSELIYQLVISFSLSGLSEGIFGGNGLIWQIASDKNLQAAISNYEHITIEDLNDLPEILQQIIAGRAATERTLSELAITPLLAAIVKAINNPGISSKLVKQSAISNAPAEIGTETGALGDELEKLQLTPEETRLFTKKGEFYRAYEKLGAHPVKVNGKTVGVYFAVWAPNATEVSLVGDFNGWQPGRHAMTKQPNGIWTIFIQGLADGAIYKYSVKGKDGKTRMKADPFAFHNEFPNNENPGRNASIVSGLADSWHDAEWMSQRGQSQALDKPISIYEIHLGSWMRDKNNKWLSYREIAPKLAEYLQSNGFTHVELMPVSEYFLDTSWGYQVSNYYAPTSRFGSPEDFAYLIDFLHQRNIGVICDWVPGHYPKDEVGLDKFDGTNEFSSFDRKEREQPEWGTNTFNYGKSEVQSFLIGNALFWLEKYHIDGIRVDAVASMLYRDYGRSPGQWKPNKNGGSENLEGVAFLQKLNTAIRSKFPGVLSIAEESSTWPGVTKPVAEGGLGFDLKWALGWMHDTLKYMQTSPDARKNADMRKQLTFFLTYSNSEKFVLPLSHDEVVYGKGSLRRKMPGNETEAFANLRLLLGLQYTMPGIPLLFMGGEVGQYSEWNHDSSVDWDASKKLPNTGLREWVKVLNLLKREQPALSKHNFEPYGSGFEWLDSNDKNKSVFSFVRKGETPEDDIIVIFNFSSEVLKSYRMGVTSKVEWHEILNSDSLEYNGRGTENKGAITAEEIRAHGCKQSVSLNIPPLGMVVISRKNMRAPDLAKPEDGLAAVAAGIRRHFVSPIISHNDTVSVQLEPLSVDHNYLVSSELVDVDKDNHVAVISKNGDVYIKDVVSQGLSTNFGARQLMGLVKFIRKHLPFNDINHNYARDYTNEELLNDNSRLKEFILRLFKSESTFHEAGKTYNAKTGLTYDGCSIDLNTGKPEEKPHNWSAPSKESLHISLLIQALAGNENAGIFISPENPSAAVNIALDILEKKINSYNKFNEQYPGFGGFLPWFQQDDAGMKPFSNWQDRVPGLDNGQFAWALLMASDVLEQKGYKELAQSYRSYWEMLAGNSVMMFYNDKTGSISGEVSIKDVKAQPADDNYYNRSAYSLDDPYEGELLVLFMSIFGKWRDTNQINEIWRNKTAKVTIGAYHTKGGRKITVRKGYFYSSHEMWNFLVLPYRDVPILNKLFVNGEKARTWNSAEKGIPGLISAVNTPVNPEGKGLFDGYVNDIGIPDLATGNVIARNVIAPYAVFPVLLADLRTGIVWLRTMLAGPKMHGPYGATEAITTDGRNIANIMTWDGRIPQLLAIIDPSNDLMRQALKREGKYDSFLGLVSGLYESALNKQKIEGEDIPFKMPAVAIPENSDFALPVRGIQLQLAAILQKNISKVNKWATEGKSELYIAVRVGLLEFFDVFNPFYIFAHKDKRGPAIVVGATLAASVLTIATLGFALPTITALMTLLAGSFTNITAHVLVDWHYIKASGLKDAVKAGFSALDINGIVHIDSVPYILRTGQNEGAKVKPKSGGLKGTIKLYRSIIGSKISIGELEKAKINIAILYQKINQMTPKELKSFVDVLVDDFAEEFRYQESVNTGAIPAELKRFFKADPKNSGRSFVDPEAVSELSFEKDLRLKKAFETLLFGERLRRRTIIEIVNKVSKNEQGYLITKLYEKYKKGYLSDLAKIQFIQAIPYSLAKNTQINIDWLGLTADCLSIYKKSPSSALRDRVNLMSVLNTSIRGSGRVDEELKREIFNALKENLHDAALESVSLYKRIKELPKIDKRVVKLMYNLDGLTAESRFMVNTLTSLISNDGQGVSNDILAYFEEILSNDTFGKQLQSQVITGLIELTSKNTAVNTQTEAKIWEIILKYADVSNTVSSMIKGYEAHPGAFESGNTVKVLEQIKADERAGYVLILKLRSNELLKQICMDDNIKSCFRVYAFLKYTGINYNDNDLEIDEIRNFLKPAARQWLNEIQSLDKKDGEKWVNNLIGNVWFQNQELQALIMANLISVQDTVEIKNFIGMTKAVWFRGHMDPYFFNASSSYVFGGAIFERCDPGEVIVTIVHEIGHNVFRDVHGFKVFDVISATLHECFADMFAIKMDPARFLDYVKISKKTFTPGLYEPHSIVRGAIFKEMGGVLSGAVWGSFAQKLCGSILELIKAKNGSTGDIARSSFISEMENYDIGKAGDMSFIDYALHALKSYEIDIKTILENEIRLVARSVRAEVVERLVENAGPAGSSGADKKVFLDYHYINSAGLVEAEKNFHAAVMDENGNVHTNIYIMDRMPQDPDTWDLRATGIMIDGKQVWASTKAGALVLFAEVENTGLIAQTLSEAVTDRGNIKGSRKVNGRLQGFFKDLNVGFELEGFKPGITIDHTSNGRKISYNEQGNMVVTSDMFWNSNGSLDDTAISAKLGELMTIRHAESVAMPQNIYINFDGLMNMKDLEAFNKAGNRQGIVDPVNFSGLSKERIRAIAELARKSGVKICINLSSLKGQSSGFRAKIDYYRDLGFAGYFDGDKIYDFISADTGIKAEVLTGYETPEQLKNKIMLSRVACKILNLSDLRSLLGERSIIDRVALTEILKTTILSLYNANTLSNEYVKNVAYAWDRDRLPSLTDDVVLANAVTSKNIDNIISAMGLKGVPHSINTYLEKIGMEVKGTDMAQESDQLKNAFLSAIVERMLAKAELDKQKIPEGLADTKLEILLGEAILKDKMSLAHADPIVTKDEIESKCSANGANAVQFYGALRVEMMKLLEDGRPEALSAIIDIIPRLGEAKFNVMQEKQPAALDVKSMTKLLEAA